MPSRPLFFATTSSVKFDQYSSIFRVLGFTLYRATTVASALAEPQFDPEHPSGELSLVNHPLRQVARFAEKWGQLPYMVEDTMLVIDALSNEKSGPAGLPGADTKSWWRNLQAEGVLRLLRDQAHRSATFYCQIGVYLGQGKYAFAQSNLKGCISTEVRESADALANFPNTNPFYFHTIFQPEGSPKTIAELGSDEFQIIDYRRQCASKIVERLSEDLIEARRQMELFGREETQDE
jgi:inosine/xanthosine triphosphate pyrophosphatase family protein